MPIRFRCQHCRKRSSISSRMAGQKVACPRCGHQTIVIKEEEAGEASAKDDLPDLAPSSRPAPIVLDEPLLPMDDEETPIQPKAARGAAFDLPDIPAGPITGARVEVHDSDGNIESRRLPKAQPVTFGSHSTCDIVIDERGIAALHARISWNGTAYELTAAGKDGIELNGTLVKQRTLSENDTIRIGSYDIVFFDEPQPSEKSKKRALKAAAKEAAKALPADDDEPPNLDDLYDDLDQIEERRQEDSHEKRRDEPKSPPRGVPASAAKKPGKDPKADEFAGSPPTSELTLAEMFSKDDLAAVDENGNERVDFSEEDEDAGEDGPRLHRAGAEVEDSADDESGKPAAFSLRAVFAKNERMQDQTVMRSPLILTLGGGGGILLIVAVVFWFLIDREQVRSQFEAAEKDIQQGQFAPGIAKLDEFIKVHPGHSLTEGATGAHVLRSKAKVEKEMLGSPAWANALKELQAHIAEHREAAYFPELHEQILKFAQTIALGTPKAAAVNRQRELMQISIDAEQLLDRYSPADSPPTEAKKEIAKARTDAEAAMLKADVVEKALAEMNDSLKQELPLPAIVTRKKLMVRYPDLTADRKVDTAMRRTLELAKKQVVREEFSRDAATDDPAKSLPKPLTLAVRTRALSDETSANRVVFAYGLDICLAADSITGDPLWTRVVGLDPPFFPVPVETSRSAVLLFDTSQNQLLLVDRRTGELAWRQVVEPVAGAPLVLQGQIYLPTLAGWLYRIDADSGRITSRIKFPQELLAPPIALGEGSHLLVIGESEFAYSLSVNPLECKVVSHIGHDAGVIGVAPQAMGKYVLLAENDRATSSRLRVLNTSQPEQPIPDAAEQRIEGHIRDEMILRGNQLLVISGGPRLSVFNVSDDKNQRTLAPVAALQIPTSHSGSAHLAAGADGQIWLAAGGLRKIQLKTDILQFDQQPVAVGQSVQPIQMIGSSLYIGRQLPLGQAVHLTQADGQSMQSNWKTVVGASVLAAVPGADGQLVCVSNAADTFLIGANELNAGGFRSRAEQQLKLPEQPLEPLFAAALTEGRIAVWTGGAEGKLWIIGSTAQPQSEIALQQSIECPPIRFANGVLFALPGKLRLAGRPSGPPCDDFLAPVNTNEDAPGRKWKHLIPIDDDQVFAMDNSGKLLKLQFRTAAKCFFQTVSQLNSPQPIDVPPTIHKGRLLTADAAGTLRVLDVTAMETRAEVALGAPPSKPLWVAEPLLLAEVSRQKLVAFDADQPKQPLWSLNLAGVGIVGVPQMINGALIAVQQNGDVLRIDPKSGEIAKKVSLGQIATLGPFRLNNLLVAVTADGSLHHVESLAPSLAQAAPPKPQTPPVAEKPSADKPEKSDNEKPSEEKTPKTDKPAEKPSPE